MPSRGLCPTTFGSNGLLPIRARGHKKRGPVESNPINQIAERVCQQALLVGIEVPIRKRELMQRSQPAAECAFIETTGRIHGLACEVVVRIRRRSEAAEFLLTR